MPTKPVTQLFVELHHEWLADGSAPEASRIELLVKLLDLNPNQRTVAAMMKFVAVDEPLTTAELQAAMEGMGGVFVPAVELLSFLELLGSSNASDRLRGALLCDRMRRIRPELVPVLLKRASPRNEPDQRVRGAATTVLREHGLFDPR